MKRYIFSHFMFFTGLLHLWRWLNRDKVVIITLHSVLDPDDGHKWSPLRTFITTEDLDNKLAFLARHFNFISLNDAYLMLKGDKPTIPHGLVVTFDDGFYNNIKYALPLLKKHRVPATIFPATAFLAQQKPFWFDRLDYAIQHNIDESQNIEVYGKTFFIDTSNRQKFKVSVVSIIRYLLSFEPNDNELPQKATALIEEIESKKQQSLLDIFTEDNCTRAIPESMFEELAKEKLLTFGSHTHDHTRVTGLPSDQDTEGQLKKSKERIKELVSKECNFFCYPNGDHDNHAAQLVDSAGYLAATTTKEGLNKPGDPLMKLKRFNFSGDTTCIEFLCVLSGLYTRNG